jgi:hypothetical protein
VSPDAHSPAERADAVLRAAEAAAAAAQAAAAAAHAASLPAPSEAPPAPPPVEEVAEEVPPAPQAPAMPPVHEAGAPARLLAAAGELEAQVARARAQLDALDDALARVERSDEVAE